MYERMKDEVTPMAHKAFRDSVFWAPEIWNERWAEELAEMVWACASVATRKEVEDD
jgi:hypothetical protein